MKRLLLLQFIFLISTYSFCQTNRYWSGNGSSDNISDGSNWFNGNPTQGDNLYFNNSQGRKNVYINYATNSYFGEIKTFNGASNIKIYGDNTYAYKFENDISNAVLFEISPSAFGTNSEIGNRINSDIEINPVGSGGILISCNKVSLDNTNGARSLKIYGGNTLTVNAAIYEKNGVGGKLELLGNASVFLNRQNTYTGLTILNAGTLYLNRVGGATLPSTNNVEVNNGATLRISSDQTLNTITLNGGIISVDAGVTLTLTNLVTNGGSISGIGNIKITDVLTVNLGTFTTNNNITLVSNAAKTARVSAVSGTLVGDVTVERYITGRRAYRFLTPAVTTTTSIFANWQNAGATTAGIGTQITGSITGANGFDQTISGNASLATYNAQIPTGTGFVNAANTNVATLKAGVGYRLLVRGDRGVNLSQTTPDDLNFPTTLSAKGTLTTGTVTFSATDAINSPVLVNNTTNTQTNGYTLIGNPYASPVDWNAVTKTGVANNAYYTWDPTLGTPAQRGRYVVYSADNGMTNVYGDMTSTLVTSRQFLQTGQAVFIKNAVLGTPATLVFNEANKATTNAYVFKNNQQAVTVTGSSSLYLTVFDSNELAIGAAPIDGSVALFGASYNNALDANDVDKLTTSGENLAFVRENKNLAIETLAPVVANDELFVKTVQFQANKNYTFRVNTANFDTAVTAKMVDLYLNTETAIDLTQPSFVTFTTTADATSYGADRFKIVFNNAASGNGSFNASTVAIYPNPIANNEFTIALPNSVSGNVTVKMSNMLGQEVYSYTSEATTTIQIQPKQQLEEGIYVVSISNNGQVIQAKVIVKN